MRGCAIDAAGGAPPASGNNISPAVNEVANPMNSRRSMGLMKTKGVCDVTD
jgi:hypothetical protein